MGHNALTKIQKRVSLGDLSSDEFYTRYEDIAKELSRYMEQLENKRILCPCDWDVSSEREREKTYKIKNGVLYESITNWVRTKTNNQVKWIKTSNETINEIRSDSQKPSCNFWKYLTNQMLAGWKIKSITFSGFDPKTKRGIPFQEQSYDKYDVVITNPPFSKMIEFINLLIKNNKKFLIIGDINNQTKKEFSKYFINNKIWFGYHSCKKFLMPYLTKEDYEKCKNDEYKAVEWDNTVIFNGMKGCYVKKFGNIAWYTNLDVSYRHDLMLLSKKYKGHEKEYHFSKNLPEILLCRKVKDIPCDYEGLMYVPISFGQIYSPEQFKILSISTYWKYGYTKPFDIQDENGKRIFMGYIVKNLKPTKTLTKNEEDELW